MTSRMGVAHNLGTPDPESRGSTKSHPVVATASAEGIAAVQPYSVSMPAAAGVRVNEQLDTVVTDEATRHDGASVEERPAELGVVNQGSAVSGRTWRQPRPLTGAGQASDAATVSGRVLPAPSSAHEGIGQKLVVLKVLGASVVMIVVAAVVYIVVGAIVSFGTDKVQTLVHGETRSDIEKAYVGHEEQPGHPTAFWAANVDKTVGFVELPGGDWAKAKSYPGPYIVGMGEEKSPVLLDLSHDVNCDNRPDVIETIKDESFYYINSGRDFHLATPDEQAQITTCLSRTGGSGASTDGSNATSSSSSGGN